MALRRSLIALVSVLILFGFVPRNGWAQAEFDILPEDPAYTFGENISFRAVLESVDDVEKVVLFIQPG